MSKQSDLINVGNIIDRKAGGGGVEIYGDDNPLRIIKDSSTAGWCYQEFYNQGLSGGRSHYLGAGSDSSFHIGNDTVGTFLRSDTAGRVTMPYQPYLMLRGNNNNRVGKAFGNVDWLTVVEADGGISYNSSNQLITAPASGKYLVHAKLYTYAASTWQGHYALVMDKNLSQVDYVQYEFDGGSWAANLDYTVQYTSVVKLSANDTLRFRVAGDSNDGLMWHYEGTMHNFVYVTLLG